MSKALPHTRSGTESPTFVLLHFFAGSQHEWSNVVRLVSPHYECITVDLPGFGDAAAIRGFTISEMMHQLTDTLIGLELDDFILVGHSMSGKVALALAAEGLAGLRALALVAPSPPGPEPIDESNRKKMLGLQRNREDGEIYLDAITTTPLAGEIREKALDDFIRCSPDAWTAWLNEGSKEDWAQSVGVTDCHTLIVSGETDPSLSASVQRKMTLPHLSNGCIQDIRGCGHLPMLEKPTELASIFLDFVGQTVENSELIPPKGSVCG